MMPEGSNLFVGQLDPEERAMGLLAQERFGKTLQSIREELNLSQAMVADWLGVTRDQYRHMESGEVKPTRRQACWLMELFGLTSPEVWKAWRETGRVGFVDARPAVPGRFRIRTYENPYGRRLSTLDVDSITIRERGLPDTLVEVSDRK